MSSSSYRTEFILSKDEYSPGEFFEIFKKNLPQLISVTQGFYGEKQVESFERGQTLYIREHTAQRRVVATVLEGPRLILGQQISIPIDYDAEFSILKKGKPSSKKTSLSNAVAKNKFPLEVIFLSKKDTDLSRFEGKRLILRLTELYDDVFFLGHDIIEGEVTSVIQTLPLYLREMRMSPVTGCKDYSEPEWVQYKDLIHNVCTRQIKLDTHRRNREIALYVSDPQTDADNIEVPNVYCTLHDCLSDENVYEKLNTEYKPGNQDFDTYEIMSFDTSKMKPVQNKHKVRNSQNSTGSRKSKPLPPEPDLDNKPMVTKHDIASFNDKRSRCNSINKNVHLSQITENTQHDKICSPQIQPVVSANSTRSGISVTHASHSDERQTDKSSETIASPKLVICSTHSVYNKRSQQIPTSDSEKKKKETRIPLPESEKHKASVKQVQQKPPPVNLPQAIKLPSEPRENSPQSRLTAEKVQMLFPITGHNKNHQSTDSMVIVKHLKDYTTEEIGDLLVTLNLKTYIKTFKRHLIDGAILSELDETVLCGEYGMKKVEALRLMLFVRQSHTLK